MADKSKTELERIYTIPLRKTKSSPRNHRTDRAVRAVKAYLEHHMKASDVWIDMSVNEKLWARGMYQIPSRIRVRALKFDDGVVEVTLPEADVSSSVREKIQKAREDKAESKEKKGDKKEKGDKAEDKKADEKAEAAEKKGETPETEGKSEKAATKGDKKEAAEKDEKTAPKAEKKEPAHKEEKHAKGDSDIEIKHDKKTPAHKPASSKKE